MRLHLVLDPPDEYLVMTGQDPADEQRHEFDRALDQRDRELPLALADCTDNPDYRQGWTAA